jgi:NAD(P)-dependent dehydrogenase (short-subunit alcohol dehydrogenase family)
MSDADLTGRRVLLTGASRGVGAAGALARLAGPWSVTGRFAEDGAEVPC